MLVLVGDGPVALVLVDVVEVVVVAGVVVADVVIVLADSSCL